VDHLREFGLSRDPFTNDLAEGFFYESPMHRAAERRLLRAVTQHKGLCLLVGETGLGKSLLARRVLEDLEEEAYEASLLVILKSGVDAVWLLTRVARQLGVQDPADDALELLGQIYEQLSVFAEEGRRAVVIIDDAHLLMSQELMEALRALVDLEYEERQLLTLILVGDAELDRAVALDTRLPQRLDVRVCLQALDLSTSSAYLGHRITVAGGFPSLVEAEALEVLHRLGQGLPRRLNVLADNALFEAHLDGRTCVTAEDVERAARDLGLAAVDLAPLADGLPGSAPGGEPIDLTLEVDPGETGGFGGLDPVLGGALDDEKPAEAAFFDQESPATVVMGAPGDGVDRDVDDLFDNLIDK
jgi:type II secretory pathway predicted ATPase ExeA